MRKRFLAAFVAAVLLLTLTQPALAVFSGPGGHGTRFVASGACGDELTWELDLDTGVLTISGTGPMYDYECDYHWTYDSGVTSAVVGEGVTSLGANAFWNCSNLASIELPDSLTSIGDYAFSCCSSLVSTELPSGITSIGESTFAGCSSLASIELPDGLTEIGPFAFSCCSSLASIELPDSLISIGDNAFEFCDSLESVEIPDSVTSIGSSAFYECTSLVSVELPDGLTEIDPYMFSGCVSLASIELPAGVTSIGDGAFAYCSGITSLEIPANVTSIGNEAFAGLGISSATFMGEPPVEFGLDVFAYCGENFCIYYMPEYAEQWSPYGRPMWNGYPVCQYGQTFDPLHFGGSCGDDLTWTLDVDTWTLTISGSGAMYDFTGLEDDSPAPWSDFFLYEVVLPEGLTHIGDRAFRGQNYLTAVDLPSSLTSIGDSAFQYTGLTSIELPDGLLSVGDSAFNGLAITSLEIPASVTSMGNYAFGNLTGLTSLVLPEGLTAIDKNVFTNCSALTSLNLPSSLTSIGEGAFANCRGIMSLEIPAGVASIGNYAFSGLGIASATFLGEPPASFGSDVFPASMICIYYQPENASSWSPNGETEWNGYQILPVGEVGHVGGTCGDDLVWALGSDGVLTISGTGEMYDYEEGQTPWYGYRTVFNSIVIEEGVTKIGEEAFDGCSAVTSVQLSSTVTYIGPWAFQATSIASIELPAGLTFLGDGAFYGCTALESIVIPDGVTSIGEYAFWQCTSLASIELPDGITSIGGSAFYYCSALTSIDIPDGVTSIGNFAFWQCTALESIELPDGLTSIGEYAFCQCSSLTSIDIPDGVTSIPQYAFYQCSALVSVGLPDSLESIDDEAFFYCRSLTSIELPDGLTSIGSTAFYYCSSLASIEFPDGLTSIGANAFLNCLSFETITLPDTLESIGSQAFAGCSSLSSAYFLGEPPIGSNIFYACASGFCIYYYADHVGTWSPNGETTWKGYPIVMIYDPENPPAFTVTFVDGLTETTISEIEVVIDTVLGENDLPAAPEHEGYVFVGWDYNGTAIRSDRTVTASYQKYYSPDECVLFDFESQEEADLWTAVDSDGDGYNWFWSDNSNYVYTGVGSMASESWNQNPLYPDNWLISPAIQLKDAPYVSMYIRGTDEGYLFEHFAVYAGTSPDIEDMVQVLSETVVTFDYVQYSADLSAFAGEKIYIAIRHFNCSDMYMLALDRVEIFGGVLAPTGLMGDVDGNGSLSSFDALLILRHALGIIELSSERLAYADVSGDGEIDSYDALLVLRMTLGLIQA